MFKTSNIENLPILIHFSLQVGFLKPITSSSNHIIHAPPAHNTYSLNGINKLNNTKHDQRRKVVGEEILDINLSEKHGGSLEKVIFV